MVVPWRPLKAVVLQWCDQKEVPLMKGAETLSWSMPAPLTEHGTAVDLLRMQNSMSLTTEAVASYYQQVVPSCPLRTAPSCQEADFSCQAAVPSCHQKAAPSCQAAATCCQKTLQGVEQLSCVRLRWRPPGYQLLHPDWLSDPVDSLCSWEQHH